MESGMAEKETLTLTRQLQDICDTLRACHTLLGLLAALHARVTEADQTTGEPLDDRIAGVMQQVHAGFALHGAQLLASALTAQTAARQAR